MASTSKIPPESNADRRMLSAYDSHYFDNGFAPICGIFGFASTGLGSDRKLHDAFHKVIKMLPLLQTRVYDEGANAYFGKIGSEDNWPHLLIYKEKSDDVALATARAILEKTVNDMNAQGQEAQRTSVRLVAVRGRKQIELALAVPHHFLDGTGVATFGSLLYLYARCPKIIWPLIDRLCPKDIPSFLEMTLKSDYDMLIGKEIDCTQSPRQDPNNFCFDEYDLTHPDATSKLSGLTAEIGSIDAKVLMAVRASLRKSGVTLTSTIDGLAIKVLAVLLKQSGINVDSSHPLLSTCGADPRKQGKWKDSRDKAKTFPVAANYAYSLTTQVTQAFALDHDVQEIAKKIRATTSRATSDSKYRLQELTASSKSLLPTSKMFVGSSSVVVPSCISFLTHVESKIAFGSVPHIWFFVITCGKKTSMLVDVQLPLSISEKDVQDAIKIAVGGSALEPLFAWWS